LPTAKQGASSQANTIEKAV